MNPLTNSRILEAGHAFVSAIDDTDCALASDTEMVDALGDYGQIHDRAEAAAVLFIGRMIRSGVFDAHGYPKPEYAIAEALGWDRRPARRRVRLAEQVCPRVSLDGQPLPPLLPATAAVFTEGRIAVGHAEAIVEVLNSPAARRLHPHTWADAEHQIAHYAATTRSTPSDVAAFAKQLLDMLDQNGPEPPDEPEQVNDLWRARNRNGTGGRIRGELDGPTHDALDTFLSAMATPLPGDDRSQGRRDADTLGELCEFGLRHHTDLPDTGGERPRIRVTLDYNQLRNAVTGAHMELGLVLPLAAADAGVRVRDHPGPARLVW